MLDALLTTLRILTFCEWPDEFKNLNRRHLALGLGLTWLVGMGRWWEDPRANLLQHLGVGSVVYVFVLAAFLWLLLWPMVPPRWSFLNVLTFISLTSVPGILYAIPVRHGLNLHTGQTIRLWFLAIVAGWRVLLLYSYIGRGAGLQGFRQVVATLFPLTLVVVGLTALNLDQVVFNMMGGGIPEEDRTVNDSAYGVLLFLTSISVLLFVPLFISYAVLSISALLKKYRPRQNKAESESTPAVDE